MLISTTRLTDTVRCLITAIPPHRTGPLPLDCFINPIVLSKLVGVGGLRRSTSPGTNTTTTHARPVREGDYGTSSGGPAAELNRVRAQHIERPSPGGQSYLDVIAETRDFLTDIARQFDGRRVCVIAHLANKWALDVLLHGKRIEDLVAAPFEWQPGWEYTLEAPFA